MLVNWGQSVGDDKGRDVPKRPEIFKWAAPIGLAMVIAWLSLAPPGDQAAPVGNDKIGHFLAYGALTVATLWAAGWQRWFPAFLACLAYGAAMEVAQGLMPFDREFSPMDMAANTAGALAALTIFWIALKR